MKSTARLKLVRKDQASLSTDHCRRCGLFFREWRTRSGLSQEQVAKYLETSVDFVRAYEEGRKAIPLNRAKALSNCLNIPPRKVLELFQSVN